MSKEDVAAGMYMLGSWKMRRLIIKKAFRKLTMKELAEALLLACFVDICKLLWGKDWVREKLNGAKGGQ